MDKQHYLTLQRLFTRLSHFDHLNAIASWDMAAMMPSKGGPARGAALAELSVLRHQLLSDPRLANHLEQAQQETLSEDEQANLREMSRHYQQAVILPDTLVEQKSLAGSRCEQGWRIQRPANDWDGFSENLKEVVRLSREEARIRAEVSGISPYDALLDLYEPGMTSARLDQLFGDVQRWLPSLLSAVIERQRTQTTQPVKGPFAIEKQKQLGLDVMQFLSFDFNAGRLDTSAHPFCGGVPQDVRITTRYNPDDLFTALFGVIHETGHARYEQNLPQSWLDQPLGLARSMGIHESQSLFFEMQLGRSPAFLSQLLPKVSHIFGAQPALTETNFVRLNQHVSPGLIRVDADEVSYPAHVILRYEIERALINGDIEVEDIPALWNEKMQNWLGLSTAGDYRNGCMQDIHWTDGSFGYFPSYTLGAMYAAQLHAALRTHIDTEAAIRAGDLSGIFDWLTRNIWSKGSRFTTDELIQQATGETLNPAHFRAHLESRYLA